MKCIFVAFFFFFLLLCAGFWPFQRMKEKHLLGDLCGLQHSNAFPHECVFWVYLRSKSGPNRDKRVGRNNLARQAK